MVTSRHLDRFEFMRGFHLLLPHLLEKGLRAEMIDLLDGRLEKVIESAEARGRIAGLYEAATAAQNHLNSVRSEYDKALHDDRARLADREVGARLALDAVLAPLKKHGGGTIEAINEAVRVSVLFASVDAIDLNYCEVLDGFDLSKVPEGEKP